MSVCVFGSINLDWVARVNALPRPGETVLAARLSRQAGGKGLNQAIAAVRAGADVKMAGLVGSDEAGEQLVKVLEAAGVDVAHVGRTVGAPTGQAFITVSADGENCIVVVAGANAVVESPPPSTIADARVLLAQLEVSPPAVAALFDARPPGCLAVLNAAPALPVDAALFALCDVLVLNETELAAYTGGGPTPRSIEEAGEAAHGLLTLPGQGVVVTLGARGALLVTKGAAEHFPGRPATVAFTVGAGDCFCGVLAAGLDQGLQLAAAVARANIAASLAVSRRGMTETIPMVEKLNSADRSRSA